jgi:hypothetical protein
MTTAVTSQHQSHQNIQKGVYMRASQDLTVRLLSGATLTKQANKVQEQK